VKFNRTYSLKLESADGNNVTIEPPYTIEFAVRRENLATSQSATITIYNLSEIHRNQIYKDRFNTTLMRAIQLRAGYQGNTPLIFNGTIFSAASERIGTDFKTTIECMDGAYAIQNAFSNVSIGTGQAFGEIIATLNKDLAAVGLKGDPIIGTYPGSTRRGSVYLGNTWNYLLQLTGRTCTIDNGQLKALNDNEVVSTEIPLITSASGLLGSPKRENTMITFRMLFEPRLTLGQVIQLDSTSNSLFNGTYKVVGFTHNAVISPVKAGEAVTRVSLWKGTEAFKTVPGAVVQ
jgi:hypothetical protein